MKRSSKIRDEILMYLWFTNPYDLQQNSNQKGVYNYNKD